MQGTQERKITEEEEKLGSKDGVKIEVTKYQESHWREKLVEIVWKYPYRKPTQVDEERILRWAREALLRNSANWPRNFGRRGAYVKVGRSEKAQATV